MTGYNDFDRDQVLVLCQVFRAFVICCSVGTRRAEALNSLMMKITAKENDSCSIDLNIKF